MRTVKRAVDSLAGKTSDEIAAICEQHGIQGKEGSTVTCPLAALFHQLQGGHFVIGRKHVYYRKGDRIEKIATPQNLADFVRKFDTGGYPHLIAAPKPKRARAKEKSRPENRHKQPQTRYPTRISLAKLAGRFE